MWQTFKTIVTDGWITKGPQIHCEPGQIRVFMRCVGCNGVYPQWWASMTAAEIKKRGFIGCKCGSLRLSPTILPSWKALWWFAIRGWFVRWFILRIPQWDPRMVALEKDLR